MKLFPVLFLLLFSLPQPSHAEVLVSWWHKPSKGKVDRSNPALSHVKSEFTYLNSAHQSVASKEYAAHIAHILNALSASDTFCRWLYTLPGRMIKVQNGRTPLVHAVYMKIINDSPYEVTAHLCCLAYVVDSKKNCLKYQHEARSNIFTFAPFKEVIAAYDVATVDIAPVPQEDYDCPLPSKDVLLGITVSRAAHGDDSYPSSVSASGDEHDSDPDLSEVEEGKGFDRHVAEKLEIISA
ncbi:hypothetical protein EBZ39_06125 [bacterium]|nr:hypothetical protein [bacterium]